MFCWRNNLFLSPSLPCLSLHPLSLFLPLSLSTVFIPAVLYFDQITRPDSIFIFDPISLRVYFSFPLFIQRSSMLHCNVRKQSENRAFFSLSRVNSSFRVTELHNARMSLVVFCKQCRVSLLKRGVATLFSFFLFSFYKYLVRSYSQKKREKNRKK